MTHVDPTVQRTRRFGKCPEVLFWKCPFPLSVSKQVWHPAIHPGRQREMQDHIVFSPDGKEDIIMVFQQPPSVFQVND